MVRQIRLSLPSDEPFLLSWCIQRGLPAIPSRLWPKHHYIVTEEGKAVGSVFLVCTDWVGAYIEGVLLSPALAKENRGAVLRLMVKQCLSQAKELGFLQVQTATSFPSILAALHQEGFSEIQDNAKIVLRGV